MEIRRKESCKDEKAALKFGGIAENVFLCGVKTSVLATPLSAGSKTLSPLLHLKATFQGRLLFFIFFHTRFSNRTSCKALSFRK